MARSGAFESAAQAGAFARDLDAAGRGIVVKADGLAAGKGVTVCDTIEEAEQAIEAAAVAGRVVVEERLEGREASLIALCDGHDALALPIARDHKRLGDGDTGPNTGGMGAYSPLPDIPDVAADDLIDRFHRPILAELARRGTPFRGALYAGLMLTADGPILLECNARFGDPETQVILPRLAVPLGPLLLAAAGGRLLDAARPLGLEGARLPVLPMATVGIVLAAAGYPDAPRPDDPIEGLDRARAAGALVFHGGTTRNETGDYGPRAGGSSRWSGAARTSRPRAPGPRPPSTSSRSTGSNGATISGRRRDRGSGPMIRRYTLAEMGAIWSESARFEQMLRVELAVARAQTARGLIPAAALEAIETRATVDVDRIAEIERTTDHDIIAFVSQVAEAVGPEGRYLHLGLTSSDVVDTGLALQLRAAGNGSWPTAIACSPCSSRGPAPKPTRR